jgi:hypothetical protein
VVDAAVGPRPLHHREGDRCEPLAADPVQERAQLSAPGDLASGEPIVNVAVPDISQGATGAGEGGQDGGRRADVVTDVGGLPVGHRLLRAAPGPQTA